MRERVIMGGSEGAAIPVIDGRAVISRADMAARGVARATSGYWYRHRDANEYPEKAGRIGRTDYWFEDEWTAWLESHRDARRARLTGADFSGDPDELVDAAGAAKIMGWSGRDVVHHSRRHSNFPEPDAHGPVSSMRIVPLWKRSTVWAAARARKGGAGGHKPGTPGAGAKPHPYAGDERLDTVVALLRQGAKPSAAVLAGEWGVSRRTAERIIRAAHGAAGE
jgi:hypothetical protein